MPVHVLLEHPISDYASWKGAFDRDPIDREGSGVRAYRILRPIDRPDYIAVDLEFDDRPTATVIPRRPPPPLAVAQRPGGDRRRRADPGRRRRGGRQLPRLRRGIARLPAH